MAWWDAQHRSSLGASPRSRSRLVMGDAFPKLESTHIDNHIEMERERALLSPVFEEQLGPPTTPALVVHVDIRFTDPVIRSRYCRSYGSSPSFEATNRICRGLVRRIERCSEEFITRKDSGSLEVFKGDTYERKSQRFEMTFRLIRRGKGEWAERTYRSYQKQPLTVAQTKEVTLAVHRMIGLFLRRHDENFQWLDCPAPETELEGSETMFPSRDGPLSLLSVPRSRFVEATQAFEFAPGYSIELYFRNGNPQRQVQTVERRIKITSTQTTPLTLFMSEDLLWKALEFANNALDSKKREFDAYLRDHRVLESTHSENDTLELRLRVVNNLGPAYDHVQRSIKSKLALFRDREAKDCDGFICNIEKHLSHIRDEADTILNSMNDLEFRVAELKGVGWTLREPAKFTLGPAASYGRRTIQAALDRIQTGIGDVIRGHNIAIHITANKRGHLVLDKAIVAHEKRGQSKETFASQEDAQAAFVARLKARIQKDLDKVFEDSCSIDDIPEDEDDYFSARPVTPQQPEQAVFEGPSPRYSPSSVRSSPAKRPTLGSLQASPRPRAQRVFSLSRRSTESVRSIDYLKAARDSFLHGNSRPSPAISEQEPASHEPGPPLPEARGLLLAAAEVKPARSFSLVSRRSSSGVRVSNASTLVEEQTVEGNIPEVQAVKESAEDQQRSVEHRAVGSMTSSEEGARPVAALSGILPAEAASATSEAPGPAVEQPEVPSTESKDTPLAVRQKTQGTMDTPETFVDAREFVASPISEDLVKSELSGALAGVASPRDDDEFSTAPSTPELSTGASSPRHSVLITPVYLRTTSGAKDAVLQDIYPVSEPEGGGVIDLQTESAPGPNSKQDRSSAATDVDQDALPQPTTASSAAARQTNDTPGDANIQRASEDAGDAAAPVVSRPQTPDAVNELTPTPRPSTTSPEEFQNTNPPTPSEKSQPRHVYTASLGAEQLTEGLLAPGPDFPTTESEGARGSGPSQEEPPAHRAPGRHIPNDVEPVQDTKRLEVSQLAPEGCTRGNELGAADGAETQPPVEEDRMVVSRGSGSHDAPGRGSEGICGAEAVPVPAEAGVVAETSRVGTEALLEVCQERADGVEALAGNEEVDGGPGVLATTEHKEKLATEDVAPEDVGPAEELGPVSPAEDIDVGAPETVSDEGPGETPGPVSDAEAHVESEDDISDEAAHPAGAVSATSAADLETEGDASGPSDAPKPAEHAGSDPEQQSDDQPPVPTDAAAEQDADLQVPAKLAERSVNPSEDDHTTQAIGHEVPSNEEEHAAAPGLRSESSPNGTGVEDAPNAVPEADVAPLESPGCDAIEATEESVAMPTIADAPETESPVHEEDRAPIPLPVVVGSAESPERDVADGGIEDPTTLPTVVGVAETEGSESDATDAKAESAAVPAERGAAETKLAQWSIGERGEEGSVAVPIEREPDSPDRDADTNLADEAGGLALVLQGADADAVSEPTKAATGDEPKAPVRDAAKGLSAPEGMVPEPESCGEQAVEADGLSPGLADDASDEATKSPEPEVIKQELAQEVDIRTDGIGGKDVYESEPRRHAEAANDDELQSKSFGSEGTVVEPGPALGDEDGKLDIQDVCTKPGTLGTESLDKHAAPAIFVDDLSISGPDTSASLAEAAEVAEAGLSATITGPTESPATETPIPKAVPSPAPQPTHEKPHLVPIPDLPKLSNLFPAPTRTSLSSSDAASFISSAGSTFRNSVDTIRPSTDEQRYSVSGVPVIPEQSSPDTGGSSSSSSRPRTAGYLGIGLRSESRFVEVGLRGALGDVKARRMSLPLQHLLLDSEVGEAGRPSAPASEAGGKRSRLRKKHKVGEDEARYGAVDDEQSVFPRMMMLLAGAVAIGKIMKKASE